MKKVIVMSEDEYDQAMQGLDGIPFKTDRTEASNGKFIRSTITIHKSDLEAALKAREYELVKPDDGSDINWSASIVWKD
ncbi:hypothetical protein [Companilactobacillus futsaii]|uniref:Uncharacterized protein n=2 Tax=Companilactobacillus futsaii TaxID=938155 RepID=A0A5B7SWI8_9LACO|nr:hypothetical protein [Companilactobacillus futsaii]KRK93618.1 hypothetical protein FC88_GL000193 [Companilactobacillus futsaii JCM 17355]QCX24027.1 hypothetical protein FG051_02415 [Companilactobacillus futsaii]